MKYTLLYIFTLLLCGAHLQPRITRVSSASIGSAEDFLIKDMDIKDELRKRLHSRNKCRRVIRKEMSKYTKQIEALSEELARLEKEMDVVKERERQSADRIDKLVANLSHQNELVSDTVSDLEVVRDRLDVHHPTTVDGNITAADKYPTDCDEVYQTGGMRYPGTYHIQIQPEVSSQAFTVVCQALHQAGWIVIQDRVDGSTGFDRSWREYKNGFGSLHEDFWLGNDHIHSITVSGNYTLRIEMEEYAGRKHWAEYTNFRIDNEENNYKLHISGYLGNAGDSLTADGVIGQHDGADFSTYDEDNDDDPYQNCAKLYSSGWWYNHLTCKRSNINGRYLTKEDHNSIFIHDGIIWPSLNHNSLKSTRMLIKPIRS